MRKKYSLRYDAYGYAVAITLDDVDILHLVHGSLRNIAMQQSIVDTLNKTNDPCIEKCFYTVDVRR